VTKPRGTKGRVKKNKKEEASPKPKGEGRKKVDSKTLVKKAYAMLDDKLESGESSKAIDDLVKLIKLEKDLGGKEKDVKEIKVRWESSEAESSSEE